MSRQREATKRHDAERRSRRGGAGRPSARTAADSSSRRNRNRTPSAASREASRSGPQTSPITRPVERPARAKNSSQAKARAKARKAKAPRVVRPKLTERLAARLAEVDLRPQALLSRVPFVVLVIGSLGIGLGLTLWLSTDAAERSYQLSHARERTRMLQQQKEALERDVREAESAPALAEAARKQGMIPTRDTAHLVQAPDGTWVVVGTPKPADGVSPPPLNAKLPDEAPPPPAQPVASPPEVAVRVAPGVTDPAAPRLGPQLLQRGPDGALTPGDARLPGLLPGQTGQPQGQLPSQAGQPPPASATIPGQLPTPGLTVPNLAPNSVHADLSPPFGVAPPVAGGPVLPAPVAPVPVLPAPVAQAPVAQPPVLLPAPVAQPPGVASGQAPVSTEQFGPVTPTLPAAPGTTR